MRSSQKSGRSRGKNNRNKNVGHSPNRVYESAGPDGKVRGTPQQIIDKYLALARDAQLSGDRVDAENFLQHAEHYARLLIAAQEAANERREQQEQQSAQNRSRDEQSAPVGEAQTEQQVQAAPAEAAAEQPPADGLAAIDAAQASPEIVDTPESKSAGPAKPRQRRPRPKRNTETSDAPAEPAEPGEGTATEAAE